MEEQITIYPAASLFNARETKFNTDLVCILENAFDYRCYLPQRDGFEFSELTENLGEIIGYEDADRVVQYVIYLHDMGNLIPKSDVVVANLDEPPDPGVDIEMSYSKLMGKPVIGFRTDVRNPYGPSEQYRGMHFFPAFQCDIFIPFSMTAKTREDGELEMLELADSIDFSIKHLNVKPGGKIPDYAMQNPVLKGLIERTNILLGGIGDVNSTHSLKEIARRYSENRDYIEEFFPKEFGIIKSTCC